MKAFSFTRTIIRGITLAIPLAIVFYVLLKVIGIIEKIIAPVAKKLGVLHIFGEITITLMDLIILFIIFFLLGLLMQLHYVAKFRLYMQEKILYFIPSLHHLKMMADDKLQTEKTEDQWKAVLMNHRAVFWPAYIIEETDEWISFVRVELPMAKPGKFFIAKRKEVHYIEMTMAQMRHLNRHFGKGFIELLKNGDLK